MSGEIIAIGDEILSGRVLNTTSHFTAGVLTREGYPISRITTVGDEPEEIEDVLLSALERSEFVVISGGLGPTADDVTNEAVARALGLRLVPNHEMTESFKESSSSYPMSENELKKLTHLPQGAEALDPSIRAAGYVLVHRGVPLFFLPGVPEQLRHHVINQVVPRLRRLLPRALAVRHKLFKVFGRAETELSRLLEAKDLGPVRLGYYPVHPEVHVSLTVQGKDEEEVDGAFHRAVRAVRGLLGEDLVAEDSEELEDVLGALLTERGARLAVAESCTGGRISSRITRVPGASEWFEQGAVTYSNRSKSLWLGVSPETIRRCGAVSRETAEAMALGVREAAGADYGISVTGIAGPGGGTARKPVGTVFIGLAAPEGSAVKRLRLSGTRHQIQSEAAEAALDLLRRHLAYGTGLSRD